MGPESRGPRGRKWGPPGKLFGPPPKWGPCDAGVVAEVAFISNLKQNRLVIYFILDNENYHKWIVGYSKRFNFHSTKRFLINLVEIFES